MRTLGLVVLLVAAACSEKKDAAKQEAPKPEAPNREAPKPEAPKPEAPKGPPAGSAAPVNQRKANNIADLMVTGDFEQKLQGGGATCIVRNDPKDREIDKGIEMRIDTRALGMTTDKPVNFSLKKKADKAEPEFVQLDTLINKKLTIYDARRKGASIDKLDVAADGTSATIDVILANAQGKKIQVVGTIKCSYIGAL